MPSLSSSMQVKALCPIFSRLCSMIQPHTPRRAFNMSSWCCPLRSVWAAPGPPLPLVPTKILLSMISPTFLITQLLSRERHAMEYNKRKALPNMPRPPLPLPPPLLLLLLL